MNKILTHTHTETKGELNNINEAKHEVENVEMLKWTYIRLVSWTEPSWAVQFYRTYYFMYSYACHTLIVCTVRFI